MHLVEYGDCVGTLRLELTAVTHSYHVLLLGDAARVPGGGHTNEVVSSFHQPNGNMATSSGRRQDEVQSSWEPAQSQIWR